MREHLRAVPCRAADEEDVVASVMESLFCAAEKGRVPNLADRHDLWRGSIWGHATSCDKAGKQVKDVFLINTDGWPALTKRGGDDLDW